MMKVLTADVLKAVRIFSFGGEGFPKTELKKLFDTFQENASFINVYGPTECTCICSSYEITPEDFTDLEGLPSLGKINENFSYLIRKSDENDEFGELCLLGPNVGRGYLGDEERTLEAFELYSDENNFKKPLYRTGDLVSENNGFLTFRGRIDNQIKHMGYRIELEEIEIVANSFNDVRQSVAIYVRNKDAFGKIVLFLVPETTCFCKKSFLQNLEKNCLHIWFLMRLSY